MKTKEDCFWPKISLETVAMQQHNTALIHARNLNCSFPWACFLIINATLFSALLHFFLSFKIVYISFIFSLPLRGKGWGSVILSQRLASDSPDCLHVSTSRGRRRSGKRRLLLSLQAPCHSALPSIPSWALEPASSLSPSLSLLPFLFSPVLSGIPLCPHG